MVERGKECGFPSIFDMQQPLTPHKKELPLKTELQLMRLPSGLMYPRVEVEQRTHSGDEIELYSNH